MIDFDFKDLAVVIKVAELKSFSEAAKALNMTQSAVSQRVKDFEDSLRFSLFERSRDRRPVTVKSKGEEVLHFARRLIRLREEMIEAVNGSTVRGTLRLGVSETINHTWGPRFMSLVTAAFPELVLEIDVNVSPVLLDYLLRKEVDLAFMVGPVEHQDVFSDELCKFEMAFIANKEMLFPEGPIELEQIVTKQLVTFARSTKPYQDLQKLLEDEGLRATIHTSASLEAVVGMALEGQAVAVIPLAIVENKPHLFEKLRPLKTRIPVAPLRFDVAWLDALFNPAARRVAEIARKVAKETSGSGPS